MVYIEKGEIDDCIDKITVDKLIILQVVASDLNNLYEEYGVIEEVLDYIYSETNVLLELYEKQGVLYGIISRRNGKNLRQHINLWFLIK
ncbi:MAG: hypothetical protein PHW90_01275, partial [Bacilli bacterium]|nr:hypothetical protein [Bacilli bacterium]